MRKLQRRRNFLVTLRAPGATLGAKHKEPHVVCKLAKLWLMDIGCGHVMASVWDIVLTMTCVERGSIPITIHTTQKLSPAYEHAVSVLFLFTVMFAFSRLIIEWF